VAYITGRREFRGVDFEVGPGVLVPRPETEFLVEETVRRIERIHRQNRTVRYHDCCTGSGCVAISVVLECLSAGITVLPGFSDIEEGALAWARCNADRLTPESVSWEILSGPWLAPLSHPVDVISANPPYLTDRETEGILALGWDEPRTAFQGGEDGLAAYRALIPQARESLSRGGFLLLECGASQAEAVRALCVDAGCSHTEKRQDYAGHDRVVIAEVEDG
jgi:release factor glutamine methyltransferase